MRGKVIQLTSAFIITIGTFLSSFGLAWPSYTIELLKSPQSPVGQISSTEGSLVGSLPMLGYTAAFLVAGIIIDKIGRKWTVIIYGICLIMAWSLKAIATNITTILVARFMIGFGGGVHLVVAIPFINELSHASIRGTTTTCITFCYNSGVLVSYLCGWMLSYDVIIYFVITLGTVFVVLVCFLKESPSFLLRRGKEKEARKSLIFYRGTESVSDELGYLKNLVVTEKIQNASDSINIESDKLESHHKEKAELDAGMSAWKILWTSKATQRALLTVSIHFILLVFAGTLAVETYALPLFKAAAPNMSGHACSVYLALAFFFGSMLALMLSDILGRRTQMICSSVLCAWWLAVLASLLRWSWGPEWMIPAALLAFACSYHTGVAIVPFIQRCLNVLFLRYVVLFLKMKGLSMSISQTCMSISNFVLLAVFENMVVALGLDGTFVTFSAVCALTALVAAAIMHETKGVPIEDIVANYERGFLYRRTDYKRCQVTDSMTDA